MKIKVTDISDIGENILIRFTCEVGTGFCCWKSKGKPKIDHDYDAEFNIEEALEKGVNVFTAVENEFFIKYEHSILALNGVIDSVDDDGLVYFRLAKDCIIMIESILGDNIRAGEWLFLKCGVKNVEAYAQGF